MSKKKTDKEPVAINKTKPEFKPGDKPYCEFDGVLLNANVPWHELIADLKDKGCTIDDIAERIACPLEVLEQAQEKQYNNLAFRAGASLVTMHYEYCRECYAD